MLQILGSKLLVHLTEPSLRLPLHVGIDIAHEFILKLNDPIFK